MQPNVTFWLNKACICSTSHKAVRYGIGIFEPIMIQDTGQIEFLIEHCLKPTTYSPLLCANLSTLQLEASQGGRIL